MTIEKQAELWDFLEEKLGSLNDNNLTARLIFDRVTRMAKCKKCGSKCKCRK